MSIHGVCHSYLVLSRVDMRARPNLGAHTLTVMVYFASSHTPPHNSTYAGLRRPSLKIYSTVRLSIRARSADSFPPTSLPPSYHQMTLIRSPAAALPSHACGRAPRLICECCHWLCPPARPRDERTPVSAGSAPLISLLFYFHQASAWC